MCKCWGTSYFFQIYIIYQQGTKRNNWYYCSLSFKKHASFVSTFLVARVDTLCILDSTLKSIYALVVSFVVHPLTICDFLIVWVKVWLIRNVNTLVFFLLWRKTSSTFGFIIWKSRTFKKIVYSSLLEGRISIFPFSFKKYVVTVSPLSQGLFQLVQIQKASILIPRITDYVVLTICFLCIKMAATKIKQSIIIVIIWSYLMIGIYTNQYWH